MEGPGAKGEPQGSQGGGLFWEIITIAGQAFLFAMVLRIFLFQPFSIPSSSMKPSLLVGDYIFISKFSYGYSRHSFPLSLNLLSGRVWGAEPERGDLVVFKSPRDGRTDYIKRVIGLPGDRVQLHSGVLYINDQVVQREREGSFKDRDGRGGERIFERYREILPNGVSYFVLGALLGGKPESTEEYRVPPGHYFVLGDNRGNSADSRVPLWAGGVGFVPAENLLGRAEIIFFSVKEGMSAWKVWQWFQSVRWSRLWRWIDEE